MVPLMVGRDLKQFYTAAALGRRRPTAPRLEVRGRPLRRRAGDADLVRAAAGRDRRHGRAWSAPAAPSWPRRSSASARSPPARSCSTASRSTLRHPRQAIAAGLLLVPEDRRLHGLVLADSVQHNLGLPNLDRLSFLRLVLLGRESRAGPRQHRAAARPHARRRPGGRPALRRQSAEGRAGQVAGAAAARADPRRADARRRRRRQERDLRPDGPAGRRRASPS